jgi:hypothetical protein
VTSRHLEETHPNERSPGSKKIRQRSKKIKETRGKRRGEREKSRKGSKVYERRPPLTTAIPGQ